MAAGSGPAERRWADEQLDAVRGEWQKALHEVARLRDELDRSAAENRRLARMVPAHSRGLSAPPSEGDAGAAPMSVAEDAERARLERLLLSVQEARRYDAEHAEAEKQVLVEQLHRALAEVNVLELANEQLSERARPGSVVETAARGGRFGYWMGVDNAALADKRAMLAAACAARHGDAVLLLVESLRASLAEPVFFRLVAEFPVAVGVYVASLRRCDGGGGLDRSRSAAAELHRFHHASGDHVRAAMWLVHMAHLGDVPLERVDQYLSAHAHCDATIASMQQLWQQCVPSFGKPIFGDP